MKRNEFWNPRGVRGDAYEGDWIAEGAIEVDNQAHHAWGRGHHGVFRDLIAPKATAGGLGKMITPGASGALSKGRGDGPEPRRRGEFPDIPR